MDNKITEPCPFCGSSNIKAFAYGQHSGGEPDAFCQCQECTTTGPNALTEDEAIYVWNRRSAAPASPAASLAQQDEREVAPDHVERAAEIVAGWPQWKRDFRLTKHDSPAASTAPSPGVDFNAKRLRRVCNLLGIEADVPKNDTALLGAIGSVLGMVASKIEESQRWSCEWVLLFSSPMLGRTQIFTNYRLATDELKRWRNAGADCHLYAKCPDALTAQDAQTYTSPDGYSISRNHDGKGLLLKDGKVIGIVDDLLKKANTITAQDAQERDGKIKLTPKQCAEQFRMYAQGHTNPDCQHQLRFCADFLDEYCALTTAQPADKPEWVPILPTEDTLADAVERGQDLSNPDPLRLKRADKPEVTEELMALYHAVKESNEAGKDFDQSPLFEDELFAIDQKLSPDLVTQAECQAEQHVQLKPAGDVDKAVYQSIADNYKAEQQATCRTCSNVTAHRGDIWVCQHFGKATNPDSYCLDHSTNAHPSAQPQLSDEVSEQIINLLEHDYRYDLCKTAAPIVRALLSRQSGDKGEAA